MYFTELVDDLRASTSLIDKKYVLEDYIVNGEYVALHQFLLRETFDPKRLHNVKLTKRDIPEAGEEKLEDIENELRVVLATIATIYSSKENKHRVRELMSLLKKSDQLALLGVVNKKLHCGIGISTINKVVTDLIPVVEIQLANKYKPDKKYIDNYWYATPKLDGRRVFGMRENGEWKLYSRYKDYLGSEITTLDHWKPDLEIFYRTYAITFTDGEAYNHGMTFEEIESLVGSNVNLKDTTPLKYHLFTVGMLEAPLKEKKLNQLRLGVLHTITELMSLKNVVGISQRVLDNTPDAIYSYLEKVIPLGYEGIMLRSPSCTYDFKRSDALLKVKTSHKVGTEMKIDCYVEDIEYGDFVIREDGVESFEWLPVRLMVELSSSDIVIDGTTVMAKSMKVGSGFSLKQRREWKEDESLIVGKTIEVMCQGFGSQGKMRFPRLHRIRSDV